MVQILKLGRERSIKKIKFFILPTLDVWSVEATLTGHSDSVYCVAVLADGRLATGSRDNTVKVWG